MRNYNIDILRSLIMLFIVIWHSIIHGIAISKSIDLINLSHIEILNYGIIQLLAYLTSISVNCFILISGYFSIKSQHINYDRIIKIWIQVFFYSLIIYLLLSSTRVIPFNFIFFLKTVMPIITIQYWFITFYIPLILISPYISKMIIFNSKKNNTILLCILSLLTLTFITINNTVFPLGKLNTGGMNFIWFIYLYLVGGYIKLYEPFMNTTKILRYILAILLIIFSIKATINHIINGDETFRSISYNGITFIFSVLFFFIIKNTQININNIINKTLIKIAPYTFGVYLIHDNFYIRELLWYRDFFQFEKHFSNYYFIGYIIAISITIFIACVFIDKLRSIIFKIIKVNKGITYIHLKISYIFNHFYYKFIETK